MVMDSVKIRSINGVTLETGLFQVKKYLKISLSFWCRNPIGTMKNRFKPLLLKDLGTFFETLGDSQHSQRLLGTLEILEDSWRLFETL